MSNLTDFAERELRDAGLFDGDSDYAGELGKAVLALINLFAEQGHSGGSAGITIDLFSRLARFRPITSLQNPMLKGDYIDHSGISGGEPFYQSTRCSRVFSADGGKTWYDIDKQVPRWKRWLGIRRAYVKFPVLP